jgi:CRISPR-associated exonuclease Cas4
MDWLDAEIEVPISAIEHYSYCPRQCALIHVEQTFDENQFTIRGQIAHERVDSGEDRSLRGVRTVRGMPLWSERLGLQGKADLVEFRDDGPYPVEYKVGRRRGVHADLQLCAQALCLEEMLATSVTRGAVFHHAERRRHEVEFDASLRARTVEVVRAIRQQLRTQTLPEAPNDARCPACSLINACLPAVVGERARMRGLQGALFRPITTEEGLDGRDDSIAEGGGA